MQQRQWWKGRKRLTRRRPMLMTTNQVRPKTTTKKMVKRST